MLNITLRVHNNNEFYIWCILDDVFEENEYPIKSNNSNVEYDSF